MRKNPTKTLKELASWAPYLLALSSVFVVGSLTWETRPFIGDDLEVYAAMERGEYLNKWSDILRDTSLDKWRPINNAYLFLTINLFGNSYPSFWILNTVLALVLGIVVIRFFHQLGLAQSTWQRVVVALATAVILTSPMTFFSRIGIFGFLELAPIILSILAYGLFVQPERRNFLVWAAVLLAGAALIHERYIVLSFGFALLGFLRSRKDERYRQALRNFLIFPAVWLYTFIFALDSNPLRGGGETPLDDSFGPWIVGRMLDALLFLSGSTFGRTVYMDPEGFSSIILEPATQFGMPLRVWSLIVWGILLIPVALLILSGFRSDERRAGHEVPSQKPGIVTELIVLGLLLLIPAATVVSRIEMRWLLGSLVFLALLIPLISNKPNGRVFHYLRLQFLVLWLIAINSFGIWSFNDFNAYRINTYELIDVVGEIPQPPSLQRIDVLIVLNDHSRYLVWSTGNGLSISAAFPDKVNRVEFINSLQNTEVQKCLTLHPDQCTVLDVSSTRLLGPVEIFRVGRSADQ